MEEATLSELKSKLAEEEEVYAEFLAKLDRLSGDLAPDRWDEGEGLAPLLEELNRAPALAPPPSPVQGNEGLKSPKGILRRWRQRLVAAEIAPLVTALEDQRRFNSTVVQYLNRFGERARTAAARQAAFASALVGFAQRIDRLADAKDRLYASLGNSRADLLLEAMDKRLEQLRLGVERAKSRLDGLDSSVAIARSELAAARASGDDAGVVERPPPRPDDEGLAAAHYLAFEERFRGPSDEIRDRLEAYVPLFSRTPVLELGCGRGEFLELLAEAGVEASGIDDNEAMVRACRDRGLKADQKDLLSALDELDPETLGGIFAAQVIEHLSPNLLRRAIAASHRALVPGGRLVVETVNPRSLLALVESFYRDLTHEKPLHPETLDFLLRAQGFRKVDIIYKSPVSERTRLMVVTKENEGAATLNQNFQKLNAFLYGDQDYAAIATK